MKIHAQYHLYNWLKLNQIITLFVLDKKIFFLIIVHIGFQKIDLNNHNLGSNAMSDYELQILNTEKFYDQAMHNAELEDIEILSSVVPGSRLHEIIHNPIDSGIDEG
jgi:hypothetical protein